MPAPPNDLFAVPFRSVPDKGLFAAGGLLFEGQEADIRREHAAALRKASLETLLGEATLWVLWPSTVAIWVFPFLLWKLPVDRAVLADVGVFLGVQIAHMLFYARWLNYALFALGNRAVQVMAYAAAGGWFWIAGQRGKIVALAAWLAFMALGVLQVIFVTPFLPLLKAVLSRRPANQALRNVARYHARR